MVNSSHKTGGLLAANGITSWILRQSKIFCTQAKMISKHHEDRWTKLISNGSPTISTFSPSPKHRDRILQCGLLLHPRSRRVDVTFFVLVRVEKRIGHACCECAIRLLKTKKVEDASRARIGVELGTNTSYIVSSPLNSLATNRALIPSILFSRSQRVVTRFFSFCFDGVVPIPPAPLQNISPLSCVSLLLVSCVWCPSHMHHFKTRRPKLCLCRWIVSSYCWSCASRFVSWRLESPMSLSHALRFCSGIRSNTELTMLMRTCT